MTIEDRLAAARIIPVIAIQNAEDVVPLLNALKEGGLRAAEITFRTQSGREGIRIAASEFPDFLIGAGTVTMFDEVEAARDAGAHFAVAPGTNPNVLSRAKEVGLPFFPGVMTPSDIETALDSGCPTLKFFPAEAAGGVAMLNALYAPYKHRGVRFIPTGGITAANVAAYLAHPSVLAVGGTWMVAPGLIARRNWAAVTALAREAVAAMGEVTNEQEGTGFRNG